MLRGAREEAQRGQPHQGRVPRHAVARAAHAAQRDPRLDRACCARGKLDARRARARARDHRAQRRARRRSSSRTCSTSRASSPARCALEVQPVDRAAVVEAARRRPCGPRPRRRASQLAAAARPDGAGRSSGDPDRLQQVVWNLLSNAIKFTPRGRPRRGAALRAGRTRTSRSRCATPGRASPPSSCRYVFDRFRQADGDHDAHARRARAGPGDRAAPGRAARRHGQRRERRRGPGRDVHGAPAAARSSHRRRPPEARASSPRGRRAGRAPRRRAARRAARAGGRRRAGRARAAARWCSRRAAPT